MLEFRLLGPLEVLSDGEPVSLPRLKQRALLAALVLRAGEVVSVDRLIDDLWGPDAPPRAREALQNYVSQLRKVLGAESVLTRPPGYVLEADPEQVDLVRFERLLERARASVPAERAAALREALGLFRGPPLQDLVFEPFAEREVPRVEELALGAREDLLAAVVELGRHGDAVPELEALIAEHPYRERLRALLMLALYRAGRQAEALEAFQEARKTLVDELGIEPAPELQELERAILRQDASLEARDAPGSSSVAVPRRRRAARKTIAMLACAFDGSQLSERLDAEEARSWLDRIAHAVSDVAERHGGRVDRAGADGASVAFGVPVVAEDDALRAVRGAVELRDELDRLDIALADRHGVRLEPRAAVATGDVLVGEDLSVTGEPVAVATRLAAATLPREVVVDAATVALVRHAVMLDEAAGQAARVVEVADDDRRPLRLDTPLVGRERQLDVLQAALAGVLADRRVHLVTVLGVAGVGKSRLVRELVARAALDVTTLRGRCLAHGEGSAYRPLVEALTTADTVSWDEVLRAQHDALAEALGSAGLASSHEAFRETRLHLERLARQRPLVLVIEDLHSAAGALLDLLDDLTAWSTGAPLLVVCTARPELLEARSSWGGGKRSATALALEPLSTDDCLRLVDALLGASELPDSVREYIVEAAGGNPLFVEELLTTLVERNVLTREHGRWTSRELPTVRIPSSITALLAARIDRLGAEERELLDLAAIVGRQFTRGVLTELADDELVAVVDQALAALVRRELILPVDGAPATFEFRHDLVRDVAYASVPKRMRADLHAVLAALAERSDDPGAPETARFHRARADAYRAELDLERAPE